MSTKRTRRESRRGRSQGRMVIDSPAGRWILLPGGGFGLQQPFPFGNGKTPA